MDLGTRPPTNSRLYSPHGPLLSWPRGGYEQRVSSIALGENPRGKRAGLMARSFYMTLIRNVAGRHTSLTTYAQWPTGSTHDSAFYTLGSRW